MKSLNFITLTYSERSIDRERGPLAFNMITHGPFIEPTTRQQNFTQAVRMIFEQHKIEELAERTASIIMYEKNLFFRENNPWTSEPMDLIMAHKDC
jgi:hypothetical protein